MSATPETPEDAITAEEIIGTATPKSSSPPPTGNKRPNAFTELMKPKHAKTANNISPSKAPSELASTRTFKDRDGLGAYIEKPESFPPSRVVEYNDEFVVINDMYPKSSVHLLLIPRSPDHWFQHPLNALSTNASLLASIKTQVTHLKTLVATELRRRYGTSSTSDQPYQTALETLMSSDDPPKTQSAREALLPPGRDWSKDVVAGVHAHPSMSHLHIHVMSIDRHSPCLKHRKHYNSFNTKFFVPIEDFPLEEGDDRFHPGREGYLKEDMRCWKCGRDFGNKFARLKEHLEEEFEAWKRE